MQGTQVYMPLVSEPSKLGDIVKLDKPGCSVGTKEGWNGQVYDPSYSDVLIPVLHHRALAGGIDKSDLYMCHYHLKGICHWGARCTYANIAGLKDWNGS